MPDSIRENEFLELYYGIKEPDKRHTCLLGHAASLKDFTFLEKLFHKRFQETDSSYSDEFMKTWLLMRGSAQTSIGFLSKRRRIKEWEDYERALGLIVFPLENEHQRLLLEREWENFLESYFLSVLTDDSYTSTSLGTKLNPQALKTKLAMEITLITQDFPKDLGLKDDFDKLYKIALKVFQRVAEPL